MNNLAFTNEELQPSPLCPIPDNETARLAALHALHILDTAPDERFDRITRIATALFNMPIVRITFVDENRTWFKSCTGLSVHEAPREISICSHTIIGAQPLVVRNLERDPRFRDSPQVKGKLNLRFYAGAPITLKGGCHVGAVCLMDTVPHPEFSDHSIALLQDLANVVVDELNVHKQIYESEAVLQKAMHGLQVKDRELLEVNERLSEAQRIAQLGSWSLDIRSDTWDWSPSLHGIFGLAEGQVAPSLEALLKCIHPDDVDIVSAALARSLKGEPHNVYCRGARPDGRNIYLHVYGETKTDDAGVPSMVSGTIHDITDQKIAELQITEHKNELESLVAERTEELQAALKRETEYNILQQKFVSLVSHEFRTPLAIIDAVAQGLVRRKSPTSPEVLSGKVEKIRVSVARLIELIDMTLYLSRFDAGSIQMDLNACNLGHLLQQVGKMQSEIHPSHKSKSRIWLRGKWERRMTTICRL